METKVIKIALTGPESSGKSTLSAQLAEAFNTVHTTEFARTYLEKNGPKYSFNDILYMAEKQFELENEMAQKASKILFCDTDFINFKIWLEYLHYDVPQWLNNHIESKPYAHTLLLKPDIPWVADPLREYPDKRDYFFGIFQQHLLHYGYNFSEISGNFSERFTTAKAAVATLLTSQPTTSQK
jgi:NadR type nicotinamide-nucleotide adenylyltransferase